MFKLMVDSSFIQALIFKNHPKHEVASRMAGTIDEEEYLYLPVYDLNHLFDYMDNIRDEKTRKFFKSICASTRHIKIITRKNQEDAYKLYETNASLSYEQCLTVILMKTNDMRYIISFNENYDHVENITRLFDVDKYHPHKLNYSRYVE